MYVCMRVWIYARVMHICTNECTYACVCGYTHVLCMWEYMSIIIHSPRGGFYTQVVLGLIRPHSDDIHVHVTVLAPKEGVILPPEFDWTTYYKQMAHIGKRLAGEETDENATAAVIKESIFDHFGGNLDATEQEDASGFRAIKPHKLPRKYMAGNLRQQFGTKNEGGEKQEMGVWERALREHFAAEDAEVAKDRPKRVKKKAVGGCGGGDGLNDW
jgi:hypothetical protein